LCILTQNGCFGGGKRQSFLPFADQVNFTNEFLFISVEESNHLATGNLFRETLPIGSN
jgi:hypothetical protein